MSTITTTPVPAEFTTAVEMATPSQMEWIIKCRAERDLSSLTAEQIAFIDNKIANGISKRKASELLDKLFALPKQTKRAAARRDMVSDANPFSGKTPDVPAGRYALRNGNDADNNIRFYNVFRFPDGGTSLKQLAGDERYPVRGKAFFEVLEAIAADIVGAAQLYGHERNHCGRCCKGLTRRVSRAFGIGPDCAEALGVKGAYDAMYEAIKAQGLDPNESIED